MPAYFRSNVVGSTAYFADPFVSIIPDSVPDAFSFTDLNGVEPLSTETSNVITVQGTSPGLDVPISITNGQYSVNGGAYTSSPGNVQVGDQVRLQGESDNSFNGIVDVILDIGGVTDTWRLTTRAAIAPTVNTQPTNQSVNEGSNAVFSCIFDNATSYQWYDASDDSVLTGETGTSLTVSTSISDNGNTYYCVATNEGLTVQTNTVTLTVVDITAPVISLHGPSTINLTVGDTYTEQGASWTDNLDGAGAATVGGDTVNTNAAGTYTVTYNHTDAAGNAAAQVTRTVVVATAPDTTAPVITLNGPSVVNIDQGGTYTEQGATWTDNEDGTGAATVGGDTVDVNTLGTYTIAYNHTDIAGNQADPVYRTVNVVLPAPVWAGGIETQNHGQYDAININIAANASNEETITMVSSLHADTGLSFNGYSLTGTLSQADADASPFALTFRAENATSYAEITLTFTVTDVNDAPQVGTIPSVRRAPGSYVFLNLSNHFTDFEGDTLTYSISALPVGTGLSFDTNTGVLSGTLTAADEAAQPISITVTADDSALTSNATFDLAIREVTNEQGIAKIRSVGVKSVNSRFIRRL